MRKRLRKKKYARHVFNAQLSIEQAAERMILDRYGFHSIYGKRGLIAAARHGKLATKERDASVLIAGAMIRVDVDRMILKDLLDSSS